ncbi:MAG: hypothetical protein HC799_01495 [Limnothrix sp. RL_2_0]|nr:hypothetical protein [Limnothrix sp. RL_2_0]
MSSSTPTETKAIASPEIQASTGFEPPILATNIKFAADYPKTPVAAPTGKTIEPPILAQTAPIPTTPFYKGFEPPILATNIKFAAAYPQVSASIPTGIMIEPPILAQAS